MKFTIFLPVHNGGVFFKKCVSSILDQSYDNFNLIVLDNASNDDNLSWLASLHDSRINIIESDSLLSIEKNWARICQIDANEFMTITGHDDLFDPDYLSVISDLINKYPNASLYQTHFRLIDTNGRKIRMCQPMSETEKVNGFLQSRFSFNRDSFGTGYMFRSSDYKKVGGIPLYRKLLFADDALWVSLMQDSYKVTAPDICFSYRVHKNSASYSPDFLVTYDGLKRYLEFLRKQNRKNVDIASVIENHLWGYMLFWFRWAYFSQRKDKEGRKVVESHVREFITWLEVNFPDIIGAGECVESDIKRYLHNPFSPIFWFAWRARKWVERRYSKFLE